MLPRSIVLYLTLFTGIAHCRDTTEDFSLSFTLEDLRLSEITHISELGDTVFLVKRATDAIIFRDDDAKETNYEFSYKTDHYEHAQKGMIKNGELSVVGAYTVQHPNGHTQTTMYIADKHGYRPMVQLRFGINLLKSAVGR